MSHGDTSPKEKARGEGDERKKEVGGGDSKEDGTRTDTGNIKRVKRLGKIPVDGVHRLAPIPRERSPNLTLDGYVYIKSINQWMKPVDAYWMGIKRWRHLSYLKRHFPVDEEEIDDKIHEANHIINLASELAGDEIEKSCEQKRQERMKKKSLIQTV